MRYVRAQAVLPKDLLAEIQKYVQGELLYIPKLPGCCTPWGSQTGARRATTQRNDAIAQAFQAGVPIAQLATSYHLAEETIKKIVYGRRV